ncbi:breast cancer metastasis-suppressor 1 homolog isoform X3 [Oncorhynchus tshawytscha]|uniref:breast cancer metastasis-suppressor 1 homolog isoform X3 n=1 Tax=Oncorhynchus tshawytscha TaxID=74940 RepID=UPI001C3CC492|nr:breast cancer metastasis-suppressor 1 homolog isoform X3 [Oncorhynchus tshawytscha]
MPAQPSVNEPEEEMDVEGDSELPEANGEMGEKREREGGEGEEETMDESTEERESDLDESEEESSEMDDEDCERRRGECLDKMSDLEKQFLELKDKLFCERLNQVKVKLDEVLTGKAGEYREPLATLQHNMMLGTQVAGVYRDLCLQMVKHKYECDLQGARQHLESERNLLFDAMKTELLDKIRRLEEDSQSGDLTSGPFIVYMLRDIDILEDWAAIQKSGRTSHCFFFHSAVQLIPNHLSVFQAKAALMPFKKKTDKR